MVLDGHGMPLVMFSGVTGCANGTFTLAQLVGNPGVAAAAAAL